MLLERLLACQRLCLAEDGKLALLHFGIDCGMEPNPEKNEELTIPMPEVTGSISKCFRIKIQV